MAKLVLALFVAALSVSLLGCGAKDQESSVPISTREARAQSELNDFTDAIRKADWRRTCSHLTAEGFAQLIRGRNVPLSRCPVFLAVAFRDRGISGPDFTVTEAHATSDQGLQVKTDNGEEFTLDTQYRIVRFQRP